MVTVISRFRVRNGQEDKVQQAFLNRPHLVEKAPGFCGLNVLTDAVDSSIFLLLTQWTDEESFRTWHRSESHHASHVLIPKGLKLDASYTSLTIGNGIQDHGGIQSLNDVIESHAGTLSNWLMDSEAIFAMLLAPDGSIRECNKAAQRIFPPCPAADSSSRIWDYLVSSDTEHLQQRLSNSKNMQENSFLLNLTSGHETPVTWEARLLLCGDFFLLLGIQEQRHDTRFQNEIVKLTNNLAMAMREATRNNRELQIANEKIAVLARVDELTGLPNRRMLDETLPRETARASRLHESLAVCFADLDHFKSINDRFGHKAGDQVLIHLGAVLKSQLRSYALAARFGGDEFVLLLPGTTQKEAIIFAERIRKKVAASIVPESPAKFTVSLGVACFQTGETGEKLIARADKALYRAKEKGGNRVEVA